MAIHHTALYTIHCTATTTTTTTTRHTNAGRLFQLGSAVRALLASGGVGGGVQLSNFRFWFSRFFGFLPPPFRRHCHCHCHCRRHPRRHYEGGSLASPGTYVRRLTHVAATAATTAARRPAFAACKCPAPRTSLRYRRYCRRKCCRHRPRRHYTGGSLASSRSQIGESTQPRRRG